MGDQRQPCSRILAAGPEVVLDGKARPGNGSMVMKPDRTVDKLPSARFHDDRTRAWLSALPGNAQLDLDVAVNSRDIPSLDGIRAVSITLVLVSHFGRDVGWGDPLNLGPLGVRIFFVISGFLITGLLLRELEQYGAIDVPRFYFRRTLRIFPAFYFYIACMLLVAWFGWADLSMRDALPALTYTSNYSTSSLKMTLAHTWSLATEEQFYLIWPAALALAGSRARALPVLLLLMTLATVWRRVLSQDLGYPVPAFFNSPIGTGCLLALLSEQLRGSTAYRVWLGSVVGAFAPVVILIANVPRYHSAGTLDAGLSLLQNVAIALWIDWTVTNAGTWTGRLLNTRWIVGIGVASYSLYLWQQPFLFFLHDPPTLYLRGFWQVLSNPILRCLMIAGCTCFSYFLVERPLMRWRAGLERRLFKDRRGAWQVPTSAPTNERPHGNRRLGALSRSP